MAEIFLVEGKGGEHHRLAFLSRDGARMEARARVLNLMHDSGIESESGIDVDRLACDGSTPEDWEELSVQWNEFWCDEPDMQVLIYRVPVG